MTAPVAEALTINGVSLDSLAFMLSDISGLMTVPDRRGDNVVAPNRHGRIRTAGKRFDANELVLPLWINGALPDGSIPTDSTERIEFFARRDELLRLLYADPLELVYTRPNGHVVQARGEVLTSLDFTRRHAEPLAKISVAVQIYDAFWEDAASVAQDISGESGTVTELEAFVGATAPMADLLITVFGPCNNPQFNHGKQWVRYNGVIAEGQQLQFDIGSWQVGPGTGALWAPQVNLVEQGRPGPWLELDPATVPYAITFTHTGIGSATATLAGRRKYLSA